MPTPPRTRVCVFAAGVAFYLFGVAVAVATGFPSALSVSLVLVGATAWAFGGRAGIAAVVLEMAVGAALFHSGLVTHNGPPAAVLAPVVITHVVVLLAVAALRRAEFRQAATETELRQKNVALEAALAEVKELRGMLPICAWCKGIRDMDGMWSKMEAYLAKHSHATFTHGICPACLAQMNAELEELNPPS